jgi:phosphate transport system substrate-binding protein
LFERFPFLTSGATEIVFPPRFWSAAIISILTLPIQASILLALPVPEIVSIAKKSVVRIDGAKSGTGFIIKKSGNTYTVLTNAHVLDKPGSYQILAPDGRSYPLSPRRVFPSGVDLAEAEFTSDRNYQVAELANSQAVEVGSNVYSYGWSGGSTAVESRTPQFLQGNISSIKSGNTYKGYNLIYNLSRVPGLSGSPLFNEQGKVIGIYGLQDDKATLTLGISIDTYKQLSTSTTSSSQANNPLPQVTTTGYGSINAEAEVILVGAGTTFPQPLYARYAQEIRKAHPAIKINYQGIGSGGGIKQTIAGTSDFGASDAAMTDAEMARVPGGVLLIPTAGGAVSVAYNLSGVKGLKLPNRVLSGIFTGKITSWSDPEIAEANPGLKLPDEAIKPVIRADTSGTTFIFTNHVSAIDPDFKSQIGASKEPKWPSGFLKGKGNPGVAGLVKQTPGSIGYVGYEFAIENGLPSAWVQNASGEYVAPSLKATNQALANLQFPESFRVFSVNPTKGYPIVGLTWLLIPKEQKSPEKAKAIKTMVKWMLTSGQQFNDYLNYTSIPSDVAARAIAVVEAEVK